MGVGLWPNFIIWECIQFCLLAHFELEKVFKKLDYRIFSMNKIFTEILLCDTLSWKNEYIVLLLSADKNVWHTPWSMIGVCAVFAHYRHRTATWLWLENVSTAINVYGACAITPIYLLGVCNAEQIFALFTAPSKSCRFFKNNTNEYNFDLPISNLQCW